MLSLLSLRPLLLRPWRTLALLAGYAIGVGVMVVLLSIGTAMVSQARDEKLVGGGDLTVLPDGLNVELMKSGGLGGMFLSIDHARFVNRQVLASPRLASNVEAVAPQIVDKLVYLSTLHGGAPIAVRASGQIPSRNAAVGAGATLAAGSWADDSVDREWIEPTPYQLRADIDHFHMPPASAVNDPTWAEWHYFNVVSPDGKRWAFVSFIVAGAMRRREGWGGQVLVTLHEQGRAERRFTTNVPAREVQFSTSDPDLRIGASSVTLQPDGRYAIHAVARGETGGAPLSVNLVVTPDAGAYFPGAAVAGDSLISGYVVPALRAEANGSICAGATCEKFNGAQAYHDHNWGTWRGVTWEWGAGRAGSLGVLYGRVNEGAHGTVRPLFVYLTDSLGFLAVFRPSDIQYTDGRTIRVNGHRVAVPSHGEMTTIRGDDSLHIQIDVQDAVGSDTRASSTGRKQGLTGRQLARPYFIQMKGVLRVSGRVHGQAFSGAGTGFFETYR